MKTIIVKQISPVSKATNIFITHEYIFVKPFIPNTDDSSIATIFIQLDTLNNVIAVLFYRQYLAIYSEAVIKYLQRIIYRLKVMKGILHNDPVVAGGCRATVKQIFISTGK